MAEVFEQLFRRQRTAIYGRKEMELEAAIEILAEVFRIGHSEVKEMISSRFEAGGEAKQEDGLWPQELWVEV